MAGYLQKVLDHNSIQLKITVSMSSMGSKYRSGIRGWKLKSATVPKLVGAARPYRDASQKEELTSQKQVGHRFEIIPDFVHSFETCEGSWSRPHQVGGCCRRFFARDAS